MTPPRPHLPRAWVSHRLVRSLEEDLGDLKSHGVGLLSINTSNVEEARSSLQSARRFGMQFEIEIPEITEQAHLVRQEGLEPVDAIMIGGVYLGKAIDRHLFSFSPHKHQIVVEPPVYNQRFAYTRGSGMTGEPAATEPIGHYFPDMRGPLRAEVIVPLKRFDGRQHLRVVKASIEPAEKDAKLEVDSVQPDMPPSSEIANRILYQLNFDLSGLDGAMLDHVGIAIYWPYRGTDQYWIFGRGTVSARAESTGEALRRQVRSILSIWTEANGGTFPSDVVTVARFGDECFYITGHLNGSASNYPLWDFSDIAIKEFHSRAGHIEHPRTWGYPELYGTDAYAWWRYLLNEACADLCGIIREEIRRLAAGLLLLRNTTRMGIFDLPNDHDGTGQELLARNLDIIHLDPYPVSAAGYNQNIPRDMSYCAGLARRYARRLVPWMQAHTYGAATTGLKHVSPEQVDRMAQEQYDQGVDAIAWLAYGPTMTFPIIRPDSWERARAFHRRLLDSPPPKPIARLAVVRPYRVWSSVSLCDGRILNPADWLLQQFLEVWAVENKQPYDVFEVGPQDRPRDLDPKLKNYSWVVTTEPREGAWVIGSHTEGTSVDPASAPQVRRVFAAELKSRGWLASS